MNLSIRCLSVLNSISSSVFLVQRHQLSVGYSIFRRYSFPFVIPSSKFDLKVSKTKFEKSTSQIVYSEGYTPSGTIYSTYPVLQLTFYEECGFRDITHTGTSLISYTISGGTFQLHRCSFINIYVNPSMTVTVFVEPCATVIYQSNCFQNCTAHFFGLCSGWQTSSITNLYCHHNSLSYCFGHHGLCLVGGTTFQLSKCNMSFNPQGTGQWFHPGIVSSGVASFQTTYNCSGIANGCNSGVGISLISSNIINFNSQNMVFLYLQSATLYLRDVYIIGNKPLISGTVSSIDAQRVYIDSSYSSMSYPSQFTISNLVSVPIIKTAHQHYCYLESSTADCVSRFSCRPCINIMSRNFLVFSLFLINL